MDGARVFNAAVGLKQPVSRIVRDFDSISICFSKGLGAPVGSVLVGDEDFIKK
jgi:threonine aldolase